MLLYFRPGLARAVPSSLLQHVPAREEPQLRDRMVTGKRKRLGSEFRHGRGVIAPLGSPAATSPVPTNLSGTLLPFLGSGFPYIIYQQKKGYPYCSMVTGLPVTGLLRYEGATCLDDAVMLFGDGQGAVGTVAAMVTSISVASPL